MASDEASSHLAESGVTMNSDSEQYGEDLSPSPPSSSSPVILYKPPTIWSLVRGAAINLLLPFINGMMLGFGELFAHEAAFRLGWGGTKVRRPLYEQHCSSPYKHAQSEQWLTRSLNRSSPSIEEEHTPSALVSKSRSTARGVVPLSRTLRAWNRGEHRRPLTYSLAC